MVNLLILNLLIFESIMLDGWLDVAIYAGVLVAIAVGTLAISYVFGPRRNREEKLSPYECGVPLLDESRGRFSVKFYLIAILFILFDIETVFLIPWAVVFRSLGWRGLAEMFTFIGVLGFGILYIWKRGAFDFE